ncbi:MAG: hypothetical protein ACK53Y_08940, partial [bacterium]
TLERVSHSGARGVPAYRYRSTSTLHDVTHTFPAELANSDATAGFSILENVPLHMGLGSFSSKTAIAIHSKKY